MIQLPSWANYLEKAHESICLCYLMLCFCTFLIVVAVVFSCSPSKFFFLQRVHTKMLIKREWAMMLKTCFTYVCEGTFRVTRFCNNLLWKRDVITSNAHNFISLASSSQLFKNNLKHEKEEANTFGSCKDSYFTCAQHKSETIFTRRRIRK